jgi:multicomponent Na+:H+ antiporter subunit F
MSAAVLDIVEFVTLPGLGLAALLAAWCVLRGPTAADRIVGIELLASIGVGIAACASILYGQDALFDASLVLALVAFLATLAYARGLGKP